MSAKADLAASIKVRPKPVDIEERALPFVGQAAEQREIVPSIIWVKRPHNLSLVTSPVAMTATS
ncbi:hypothetical protein IB277_14735 [Ensifer sp. ENS07]|uniref:hypothetical protein n=1 Tax=Ensifer sp. ENS07 TaxID=2769274 RepID=UPI00177A9583|nr:hypothetical protein [Ensifer sp. ENS07]MBD9637560.1 hypothetical protein [Ensifer sp. ENS07]